jgi:hypothetical protein
MKDTSGLRSAQRRARLDGQHSRDPGRGTSPPAFCRIPGPCARRPALVRAPCRRYPNPRRGTCAGLRRDAGHHQLPGRAGRAVPGDAQPQLPGARGPRRRCDPEGLDLGLNTKVKAGVWLARQSPRCSGGGRGGSRMSPPPGAAVSVVTRMPPCMCLCMHVLRHAQGRPAADARVQAGAAPDLPRAPPQFMTLVVWCAGRFFRYTYPTVYPSYPRFKRAPPPAPPVRRRRL